MDKSWIGEFNFWYHEQVGSKKKRCRNDLTRRKKGRLFLLNVDLILVVLFDYSSARLFSYVNKSVREYKNWNVWPYLCSFNWIILYNVWYITIRTMHKLSLWLYHDFFWQFLISYCKFIMPRLLKWSMLKLSISKIIFSSRSTLAISKFLFKENAGAILKPLLR